MKKLYTWLALLFGVASIILVFIWYDWKLLLILFIWSWGNNIMLRVTK